MPTALERLQQFQHELERRLQDEWEDEYWGVEVTVAEADGSVKVDYYGSYGGEPLKFLFDTLCLPEVTPALGSLSFAGEDEGANGTKDWDFAPLLDQEVAFPNLHTLSIELYNEQHNRPIVARDGFKEDGELAQWLDRAPQLQTLVTPSAPDARFFQRQTHPLRSLRVQGGYGTQRFIPNLAASSCFSQLQELDWTEIQPTDWDAEMAYNETLSPSRDEETREQVKQVYEEAKESGSPTSFAEFEALLRSSACPGNVILRDPILASDQVALLEALFQSSRPRGSLSIVSPHTDPFWSPLARLRRNRRR
jgi:hypothetical protein